MAVSTGRLKSPSRRAAHLEPQNYGCWCQLMELKFSWWRSLNPLTAKNVDLRVWPFNQPMLELTFWGFQNGMTLEDQSKGSKVRDFQSIEGKNGNIFWYGVEMVRIKREKTSKFCLFLYFILFFYFSHICTFHFKIVLSQFKMLIYY